ncbi:MULTISPECIES: proline dehydrogenase family protein [unclassified Aureispira]|uniref:proline dehydrogenase family protein n=1 Tax=unclassified Aureispira TaxID=2649989 RepID=UPI000695B2C5|nr:MULTISPECIES: proline dehydrogenase family protein [unclassified Aureispira]WMX14747.1 proline dehydrogenase family protein [Aureispira sp. CCB-E]
MAKVDFSDTAIAFERKSNKELKQTAWLFKMMNNNFLVNIGSNMTLLALKLRMPIKGIIKKTIFKQFCGGATLDECRKSIQELGVYQVASILDYGAEGKEDDAAFDLTVEESVKSIRFAAQQDTVPVISCKVTGLAQNELLEKMTAQKTLSEKETAQYQKALDRLDKICKEAYDNKVALFIDAEESWIQDAIDDMTDIMMERYNKKYVTIYNTFQMYRHDRLAFLKKSFALAQEKGYILGAKLVRGAYMEKERQRASDKGYPSPIQPNKAATDTDYNAAVKFCVENYQQIASCVASHNEYSTQYQLELMEKMNISKKHTHFNFCQLYGMSDNLTFNLAKAGYNVAKYIPFGPVKDVIPYLIRRAQENSSVDGEVSRELGMINKELRRRKNA